MFLRSVIVVSVAALLWILPGNAAELSSTQLKDAKKIYVNKCAKCHEFYDPKAYSDSEWKEWMLKMKKKARLKDEQFELLSAYTETLRPSSAKGKK